MSKNKKKHIPHKSKSPKDQNAYLAKQKIIIDVNKDAVKETFEQYYWDMLTIVLNDSSVMGKDTFGIDRLSKIYDAFTKEYDKWFDAILMNDKTDTMRVLLDERLKPVLKETFKPFNERYYWLPMTKEEKSIQ